MTTDKRFLANRLLVIAIMLLGTALTSCTLIMPQESTDEPGISQTKWYTQLTQKEETVLVPTTTAENEKHDIKSQPTIMSTTIPEKINTATPAASHTPDQSTSIDIGACPIVLLEGAPAAGGITASYSQTWIEAINRLQASQAAPITIPVTDQVSELCAADGKVHVYLGWHDVSHLTDHGEMTVTDAVALLQNSSGQPAIAIP